MVRGTVEEALNAMLHQRLDHCVADPRPRSLPCARWRPLCERSRRQP
jgi:hypothetical protein